MFRIRVPLFAIVVLAMVAVSQAVGEQPTQQQQQLLQQLPPGFSQQLKTTYGGAKEVYTHYVGAFIVDSTNPWAKSKAIFRSRPVDAYGHPQGPLRGYEQWLYYVGSGTFPYTGEYGHLCLVLWNTQPQAMMPTFLFFVSEPCHSHCQCHGYHIYSYRISMGRWRFVGAAAKKPQGIP